ncbi:GAF domain-containing protein [Psychrobium sp. 1_MG-2023]|uniref:GAF domain-containing protein n=1 Tax=Psychrobium sp. 1_MG-2023 TaxID=3062624 RepID=UPI0026BE9BC8|nr:GAF domain-containing protein [Psychrobium sp. 1_MG-2023]MDP2560379.1 GAF domain-containing protein [Psychrobium sp. 1_MG-2023]
MSIDYPLLSRQVNALIDNEFDAVAVLSNVGALLNQSLSTINWVGFYFLKDEQLVLGPFQGNVACYRIPLNKGVCGAAVTTGMTQRVADVHQFPGHIACDAASESEIVIPLVVNDEIIGVLDIDSPVKDRFDAADQQGLEMIVDVLNHHLVECH